MKFRALAVAFAATAAAVVVPATAVATATADAAAPAACGTTAAQWTGQFGGTKTNQYGSPALTVEIDSAFNVLTTIGTSRYGQSGNTVLNAGNIDWLSVRQIALGHILGVAFTSTSVTCGADGRVTAFSGTADEHYGGSTTPGTFTATRIGAAAPAAAPASTGAACGTTAGQWVGEFTGTIVETVGGGQTPVTASFTMPGALDVVVTQGGPNNVYYLSGAVQLAGGNIWWRSIDTVNDVIFLVTEFGSTSVTCGSTGTVTQFSGDTTSRCCGSPGNWYGHFVLTRTA